MLDARQRRRRVVELGARRDDVDALALAVDDHRGAELRVCPHAAAERSADETGQGDRVALDGDVHVEALLAEEDVANRPADEVDAFDGFARRGDRVEGRTEPLE